MTVKPFLKWAGGKNQLLSEIEKYYPFGDGSITKYAEPFVGGGAVLFDILSKYSLDSVYISDVNFDLINTYISIRDKVDALIDLLSVLQNEYLKRDSENRRDYYLDRRCDFNSLRSTQKGVESIKRAALMIFLNKTCFNGLYRVNRMGSFNVPSGIYKTPKICDEENLRAVADKLKNVEIVCDDFKASATFVDKHTFVYFDPPYRPLTVSSSFTSYTEIGFDDENQIELANFVKELSKTGAKVVVSNSDPKNVDVNDDFFDSMYSFCKIKRVEAARMINSKGDARGKVKELLISSF